jgi:hypothetical protein
MWYGIIFLTVVILIFSIYSFIIIPKMKKKYADRHTTLMNEFAQKIKGNEEAKRNEYTHTNSHIIPLTKEIKEGSILAVISLYGKKRIERFSSPTNCQLIK